VSPTSLIASIRTGVPIWALPMASVHIPEAMNHYLVPPRTEFDWTGPLDVTATTMGHTVHRVRPVRWHRVIGPAVTPVQEEVLDYAARDLQQSLSGWLLDGRMVACGPMRFRITDGDPQTGGGLVLQMEARVIEAIQGVTVAILGRERVSASEIALGRGITTIVEDPAMDEGTIERRGRWSPVLWVGARPLSWAHRTALETIRRGLADVLAYIGEDAETPMHHEVMHALRFSSGPGWPAVQRALIHGSALRRGGRGA
jgi:hypothetical protein